MSVCNAHADKWRLAAYNVISSWNAKFFIRIDKYENISGKTIDNEEKSCYYGCNNFIIETR